MGLRSWYPKDLVKRGTVMSAVLVDGGHDGLVGAYGKVAGGRIMETIKIIEQKYDFVNGITQLQFDSCVVIH